MGLFAKIFKRTVRQIGQDSGSLAYRQLFRRVAAMGGEVFGPVPAGHRREFYCQDEYTWVWHEEWQDQSGSHAVTTRYVFGQDGIRKYQYNMTPQRLNDEETRHLHYAIENFCNRVLPELNAIAQAG